MSVSLKWDDMKISDMSKKEKKKKISSEETVGKTRRKGYKILGRLRQRSSNMARNDLLYDITEWKKEPMKKRM